MAYFKDVAGIVLAAGFSRRLGRPKQTVILQEQTLLERAARTAREASLNPVLLVLHSSVLDATEPPGSGSLAARLEALGCVVLMNENAAEGMASSIRCGVEAAAGQSLVGAVLMTCDQVAVTAGHLRALYAENGAVTGSGYAGRIGVPAYFPAARFADLLALRGDQGARELLRDARSVPTEALALDVDTEQDVARAEQWLRDQGLKDQALKDQTLRRQPD